MNNYSYYAETVRERVDMRKAVEFYGVVFNPAGFALCPFHNEKTASFKIHKNRGHCFGCGWHNDIIEFVRAMFGIGFKDALNKINADFGLNLPIGHKPSLREQQAVRKRKSEMLAEKAKKEAAKAEYQKAYNELWGLYAYYKNNRQQYAPKSLEDEWHPLFVEAVQKIDYVEYMLDNLIYPA